MWGSSGSNVYAVGSRGWTYGYQCPFSDRYVIYHYDGAEWKRIRVGRFLRFLNDVWVAKNGEVFAVGAFADPDEPTDWVVHFDGHAWSEGSVVGPGWYLHQVWGTSARSVYMTGKRNYAVDRSPGLFHFDGTNWSIVNVGFPQIREFAGMHGVSASEIYLAVNTGQEAENRTVVLRFDGDTWTDTGFQADGGGGVWAVGPDDVYATALVQDSVRLWHYNGVNWGDVTGTHPGAGGAMWGVQLDDRKDR
jgi:hypothetical protein